MTPIEPSCSIHSVPVSMTAWRFTMYLMKLAALSFLIYCSVVFLLRVFFFFYVYVLVFFIEQMFKLRKKSAYQETSL